MTRGNHAIGPDSRRWLALGVVLLATFMGILNVFIVNVAAPSMQADLGASFGEIQLVISLYILAYAVGLVTGGRLGDSYGRKRMFVVGTAAFTLTSIASALAPDVLTLIVFRVLQGLSAALMLPQVLSIVQVAFAPRERPRALGLYGATIGLASIAGQVVGGLLIEADVAGLGWRTIFLVNVPMGVFAALAALPFVSESRAAERSRLDLVGASLISVGLFLLTYPLVQGDSAGWPLWIYLSLLASAVVLGLFVLFERRLSRRGGSPLLPPRLFEERSFSIGMLIVLSFYSGNAALFLLLNYYTQAGLDLSALASGLTFVPLGLGFAVTSLNAGRLVPRLGSKVLSLGAILMVAGLLSTIGVVELTSSEDQAYKLALPLFVSGLGQGFVAAPVINTVLSRVSERNAGAASGALLTATQVANALGVAALGAVFAGFLGSAPEVSNPSFGAQDYASSFSASLVVLVVLAATIVALVRFLPRSGSPASGERPSDDG